MVRHARARPCAAAHQPRRRSLRRTFNLFDEAQADGDVDAAETFVLIFIELDGLGVEAVVYLILGQGAADKGDLDAHRKAF